MAIEMTAREDEAQGNDETTHEIDRSSVPDAERRRFPAVWVHRRCRSTRRSSVAASERARCPRGAQTDSRSAKLAIACSSRRIDVEHQRQLGDHEDVLDALVDGAQLHLSAAARRSSSAPR